MRFLLQRQKAGSTQIQMCMNTFCLFCFFCYENKGKESDNMSLLEIENLTHTFGDKQLYKNASLTLNKGEHIGIVGQNGTGKSTLIKLCTRQIMPDTGRVIWQPKITVGYLDQYAEIDVNLSMQDFLKSAFRDLYQLEQEMTKLYERAAGGHTQCLSLAAKYQEQLEIRDFYSIDTQIEQTAVGLGLLSIGLDRPIMEMSGGQRAKVILAKLLLTKPDVLLLDEPTNFLDKEHIAWFADYLANLDNAFMVVSHDHAFLEKTANRICDIDNHSITKYYGTYSEFLKKKTFMREDYIRQYSVQQREIKKTEEFIRKNIAGRKSKMAKGRRKQLERMDKIEAIAFKEIVPRFRFPYLPFSGTEHLIVKRLSVGYHYPILSNIDFMMKGGQKVVITGFNGIGKSTLLKTLVGQIPAMNGIYQFSEQTAIGYFAQDLIWRDLSQTPIQIVSDTYPDIPAKEIRKALARCGITGEHAMQAVGTLSGGEQAKLKMCLLMHKPCNFLILDEPTNHLDVQAKEALKTALQEFPGTVLLVSHEAAFYKEWAGRVIDVSSH